MEIRINRNIIIISVLILGILILSGFLTYKYFPKKVTTTKKTTNTTAGSLVFDVQADPHMDENSDPATYKQTLANIVSDNPSFLVDLGDIFMIDKLAQKTAANIEARYTLMKGYYDLLGSIPLNFTMGNHDGETGWDNLNARSYREKYFPDETSEKNYYSFEKEGSLFIVLDPYSYETTKPGNDGWGWSLGKEQYDWLKKTLESSSAKYKFVFTHQLVGGDNQGRGGIEMAQYYEWGGKNLDGSDGFATKRAGWGKPIHELLKDNGVSIVFKGHDHLYAKQDLDGIVYQTLPQPSHAGDNLAAYSYKAGTILGGSGHLRVTVSSSGVKVDFVKANSSKDIVNSYTVN